MWTLKISPKHILPCNMCITWADECPSPHEPKTGPKPSNECHSLTSVTVCQQSGSSIFARAIARFIELSREFISSRMSLLIQGESNLHRYLVMSDFTIYNLTANLRYFKPA